MAVATIASGASLSGAVDLGTVESRHQLVAIIMPSAFTGTTLTFQSSIDDSTYNNVYNESGTELSVTCAASRYIVFAPDNAPLLANIRYIKVRSGTSASPTTEGAARTITLVTR